MPCEHHSKSHLLQSMTQSICASSRFQRLYRRSFVETTPNDDHEPLLGHIQNCHTHVLSSVSPELAGLIHVAGSKVLCSHPQGLSKVSLIAYCLFRGRSSTTQNCESVSKSSIVPIELNPVIPSSSSRYFCQPSLGHLF